MPGTPTLDVTRALLVGRRRVHAAQWGYYGRKKRGKPQQPRLVYSEPSLLIVRRDSVGDKIHHTEKVCSPLTDA